MFSKPPGIEDIMPDRIDLYNRVTGAARRVYARFNYREVILPVMEFTEVFARGIGDETDIVSKEMFTFEDRGGRSLTLRPEGTASTVRAYVENGNFNRLSSAKFFYSGPMFRAERPQRGRLRQFNQTGAEFFGSVHPYYDYESIAVADAIAREAGITGYTLLINTIGCPECRPTYLDKLKSYYDTRRTELCPECSKRLDKNPMRLLDCKNEKCAVFRPDAPQISAEICPACAEHHKEVKAYLDGAGITYQEDPMLVRGLDYYTRTTFELVSDKLGAQSAFAAGGRYDNLVEIFGGKPTPAVGFAAGVERMMLLLEEEETPQSAIDIYMIHTGGETLKAVIKLAEKLRGDNLTVDFEPETRGFKAQFKKADREKARFAVIAGEDELTRNEFTVKNMKDGTQVSLKPEDVSGYIKMK